MDIQVMSAGESLHGPYKPLKIHTDASGMEYHDSNTSSSSSSSSSSPNTAMSSESDDLDNIEQENENENDSEVEKEKQTEKDNTNGNAKATVNEKEQEKEACQGKLVKGVEITNRSEIDELKVAEAMKEASDPNTAGVIIFKDKNGLNPPITITIMKNELGKKNSKELQENSKSNDINSTKNTFLVNQSYLSNGTGEPPKEKHVNFDGATFICSSASTTSASSTVEDGEIQLQGSTPAVPVVVVPAVRKSILKDDSFRTKKRAPGIPHEQRAGSREFPEQDVSLDVKRVVMTDTTESYAPSSTYKSDDGWSKYNPLQGPLRRKLRAVTKRKQEERHLQFESLRANYKLDQDARTLLNLDFHTLKNRLQKRELTAVQVLGAFIAKSLEATEHCNAVTEFNPKALEMAEELDRMSEVKGPLHGLPFAVKDDNNVEGMDSTLGFAKNCFKPHTESAAIVLALQALGGIPFLKTNVPQTLLSFGSDNPVYGVTTSSHNKLLSPGGSSSGTGAIVGTQGCFFGTGTDIGGSLRIPAIFNGVSSLKPTFGRMSVRGISACLPNILGLDATSGIIGQNATIVSTVYKLVLENNLQSKFDPRVLPIPWNERVFSSGEKLRIGYFTQLPFFPPVGDTIETVERAVEALRSRGHTLVPIEIPCEDKIMRTAANFILADQNKQTVKLWKGEEIAKCAELNHLGSKCPHWLMRVLGFLMQRKSLLPWVYSKTLASMLDAGSFSGHDMWENRGEQKRITEEIYAVWKKHDIVGVLCPVMPVPAIPVNLPGLLPVAAVYTMMWNITDYPAGVIRFGQETGKNIDAYNTNGDQALKLAKEACKESIGSPIGVQCVGLPYQEELVLRMMQELQDEYDRTS